ncbi:MAG: phage replisome organizer N-terminal domain-containing protein [Leuconostoc pseudomesenteroides]|uniref:phage replisome organizer N-terminal domain-containing protein n=1 Tax=Leuconostoc pseudomesenteroides TaxID=33968 RepID=UPI001E51DF29|nr:phage replisome organizer N-terminal domain-containing protein [Leuconostoc pseudomesenteroides]MCC7668904.1 DnaD domain protein [Leuconostoc pseudomesenteroides]
MANGPKNKKFFWIKLRPDFFADPYIKLLRRMAGGDTYTIIYLKMLIKSAETDGVLYFQGAGLDIAEELSLILDEAVEDVRALLAYLDAKKLISHSAESEDIFLVASADLTGSETDAAQRVRKFRERQKQQKTLQSNVVETKSNDKLEQELEIEQEQDSPLPPKGDGEERADYDNFGEAPIQDLAADMLSYYNLAFSKSFPMTNRSMLTPLVMHGVSYQNFVDVVNYIVQSWSAEIRENILPKSLGNTKKFDKWEDEAKGKGFSNTKPIQAILADRKKQREKIDDINKLAKEQRDNYALIRAEYVKRYGQEKIPTIMETPPADAAAAWRLLFENDVGAWEFLHKKVESRDM